MKKKDFLNKRFSSKLELEKRFRELERLNPGQNEIWRGKNEEQVLHFDAKTRLIIVGTVIPSNVEFFYTGHNQLIYGYIDQAHPGSETNLKQLAKEGDVSSLKAKLHKLNILFLDIIDWCCSKNGDSSDRAIKGYTLDENALLELAKRKTSNKSLLIVAATRCADWILEDFGIKHKYHQLMNGGPKAPWLNILKNY